MNKQQTSGMSKQVKGNIKEVASTITGNTAGKIEGKVEKNIGKAQMKLGDSQEKMHRDKA